MPSSHDGVAWRVFEHLAGNELHDPDAIRKMTREQRLVFAINMLRQEVGSGGFDTYFRYKGGDTAPLALEAAELLGPRWVALVEEALHTMGSPYPADVGMREHIVDRLHERSPHLLDELDQRLYDLEIACPADEPLDRFVWSGKAAFFG